MSGAGLGRQTMLDRIFDQRLQYQRRDLLASRFRRHIDLDAQTVSKAGLLDRKVGLKELELVFDGCKGTAGMSQHVTEHLGKPQGHFLGARWIFDDQISDRVKTVKQKMRIDL